MSEVVSRAPTRIDLAGGTLDIWPLSLLVEGSATVNAAIDIEVSARLTARTDGAVRLRSVDQRVEESYPSLGEVRSDGRLAFLARLALALPPPAGVDVETDSAAPAGSGLGGSSALGIAVGAGLARLRGEEMSPENLLRLVQSVETQVLRVPTGVQDYYPALMGGVLALRYGPRGTCAERIETDLAALQERLVLCFSGATRSSGVSNWDMLKGYLDNDSCVVEGIGRVALATRRMESALRSGDLDEAAVALGEEWEARKTLSPKVSSTTIESQMAAAREAGALAGKVCGAGGGGCIVFLTRPGCRGAVNRALESRGARILPARLQEGGLRLEATDFCR
jgi:D-glycero-alpha-D-manno-heptose-7-phosphate kinase